MNIIDAEEEVDLDEIEDETEIMKPNTDEGLFYQDITTSTENSTSNSDLNAIDTSLDINSTETFVAKKNAENSEEIVFEQDR